MHLSNWMIGLTVASATAAGVAACSSSSSPAAAGGTGDDSGTSSSSSGSSSGGSSGSSSGSSSGGSSGSSSGSSGGAMDGGGDAGSTLYGRLGGHAGIRGAVNAIVAQELMDTDIQTYFFNQVATPVTAGHPTADQIEECFTDLLGHIAGGPESYPTTVVTLDDAGADAGSFTCRDMLTIHHPLKISGGTFDTFVTIAGGVLTSAMGTGNYTYTTADIQTVAGALVGTRSDIVDPAQADAGKQAYPGPDAN
jgi:hypothetical protein